MSRDKKWKLLAGGEYGIRDWNDYRKEAHVNPDLSEVDLVGANLTEADLHQADLHRADLCGADLRWAHLNGANLFEADLRGANLFRTELRMAYFFETKLLGANFESAKCGYNTFASLDFSDAINLDKIVHGGPSSVGVDSYSRSRGRIPEVFLRGCGLSPWEILSIRFYDPTLTPPAFADLQYEIFDAWTKNKNMINGCFISYSWSDSKFAENLRDRLILQRKKSLASTQSVAILEVRS
jgi:Pentapeptide repeats (8 copies)